MDKSMKLGGIALVSLWMKSGDTFAPGVEGYEQHQVNKAVLSEEMSYGERKTERKLLHDMAADGDEEMIEMLKAEEEARGGADGERQRRPHHRLREVQVCGRKVCKGDLGFGK